MNILMPGKTDILPNVFLIERSNFCSSIFPARNPDHPDAGKVLLHPAADLGKRASGCSRTVSG